VSAALSCKFYIVEIARVQGQGRRLKLTAVTDNSEANKSWSKYTPSGTFEIYVTNEAAFEKIDAMQSGDSYFIDLTAVEA
jgi:hypothetical protein